MPSAALFAYSTANPSVVDRSLILPSFCYFANLLDLLHLHSSIVQSDDHPYQFIVRNSKHKIQTPEKIATNTKEFGHRTVVNQN